MRLAVAALSVNGAVCEPGEVSGASESLDVFSKASGGLFARFCLANSALSSPTEGVVPGKEEEEVEDSIFVDDNSDSCSKKGHLEHSPRLEHTSDEETGGMPNSSSQ